MLLPNDNKSRFYHMQTCMDPIYLFPFRSVLASLYSFFHKRFRIMVWWYRHSPPSLWAGVYLLDFSHGPRVFILCKWLDGQYYPPLLTSMFRLCAWMCSMDSSLSVTRSFCSIFINHMHKVMVNIKVDNLKLYSHLYTMNDVWNTCGPCISNNIHDDHKEEWTMYNNITV